MERIYQVEMQHPYDHSVYFVRASSVSVAAQLALQADANTEAGKALKNDRDAHPSAPRVKRVCEFCSPEQFVT